MVETLKRKRGAQDFVPIAGEGKPSNGRQARICSTGKDVKAAIESMSKDAISDVDKQLRVPYSLQANITLTHPSVILLQQYIALSPKCEDILTNWKNGNDRKNMQLIECSVHLLTTIFNILVAVPYFRPTLQSVLEKFLDSSEVYGNLLTRMILSTKREHAQLGITLAATLVHVDPGYKGTVSRLNSRIWTMIADSGCLKALPKLLSMRRKGGFSAQADPLDKPDIRHSTIHFLLPFLAHPLFLSGSRPIVVPFFANLKDDPAVTVFRILNAIWDAVNVSPSSAVNRKTSVSLLHENSIDGIIRLYKRDGSDDDEDLVSEVYPAEMAHSFLMKTCTKPGVGVCFQDQGWYKRKGKGKADDFGPADDEAEGGNEGGAEKDGAAYGTRMLHNHILGNVVRRVGARAVEEPKIAELVQSILGACPELVASFWPYSGISVDPRLSAKWLATMSLLGHVISLPLPLYETFRVPTGATQQDGSREWVAKATPPAMQVIMEAILPSPLTKQHLSKGLQHSVGLVQHETALTLARSLQKLLSVKATFDKLGAEVRKDMGNDKLDDSWSKCLRELEVEARKRVPEVPVIIAFAQNSAASQALQASLEDADEGEKAKAVLLTEAALRLFRLYYRALPNMASEFRFDVGKLLVSSSSAKQEANARRMAREGSVIDDAGSIASFGTVGSAGMGGGFGQSRGDVAEFDALSQVHVLELLASVREWDWTAKAAGSAYTYAYHILQLRLTTPHERTVEVTGTLLHAMIADSIMFDHDRYEWDLWMQCLPRTRSLAIKTSATLALERLHLLGFIDECIRRCMKTPYRYIEEAAAHAGERSNEANPAALPSPLLFAMFEQFQAKLAGHHIATDAAEVIIIYLRQVILSLAAKQLDTAYIQSLSHRLETCVIAAEIKRETPLSALKAQTNLLVAQVSSYESQQVTSTKSLEHKLVEGEDEAENMRRQIAGLVPGDMTFFNLLKKKVSAQDQISILSVTPFAVSLSHITVQSDASAGLKMLQAAYLTRSEGERLSYIKTMMTRLSAFAGSADLIGEGLHFLGLMFNTQWNDLKEERDALLRRVWHISAVRAVNLSNDRKIRQALVTLLRLVRVSDEGMIREIAEQVTDDYLCLDPDGQDTIATAFIPWIKFVSKNQAGRAFQSLASKQGRGHRVAQVMGRLLRRSESAPIVMQNLSLILRCGLQNSAVLALRTISVSRGIGKGIPDYNGTDLERAMATGGHAVSLDLDDIQVSKASPKSLELLRLCATISCDGPQELTLALSRIKWNISTIHRMAHLLCHVNLDEIERSQPGFMNTLVEAALSSTLQVYDSLMQMRHESILNRTFLDKNIVGTVLELLREHRICYSPNKCKYLLSLASGSTQILQVQALVENFMEWINPKLTREGAIDSDLEVVIPQYASLLREPAFELPSYIIEPLLSSTVQDRLQHPEIVAFTAMLCGKASVKAMVVRQHLQLLISTDRLNKVMQQDAVVARRSIAKLALALFNASPYSACQPSFAEPLIKLYKGTRDLADHDLLSVFGLYERYRKVSLSKAIVAMWTPQLNMGADENDTSLDAVKQLDPRIVFASCIAFEKTSNDDDASKCYDTGFILSLTAACLRDGTLTGLQWVEILRSNVLALVACALASRSAHHRNMASCILGAAIEMVEATPFQEKPAVNRLLCLLRHGVAADESGKTGRLPFMLAFFFAQAFRTIGEPSSYLYPLTSAFLLRRPMMDFKDVPMLYDMLYAAGQGSRRERRWMVRFLRDSVCSRADWQICKRRHTFALLASLFQSSSDHNIHPLITQALAAITSVPEAAIHLVEKEGLVEWLEMADVTAKRAELLPYVLQILDNAVSALIQRDMSKSSKLFATERRWHIPVLNCLQKLGTTSNMSALRKYSEMVLKICLTTKSAVCARAVSALASRLRQLDLQMTNLLDDKDWRCAVDALTRCGLSWDPETLRMADKAQMLQTMPYLACRSMACEGAIGHWLKEEMRQIVCEL